MATCASDQYLDTATSQCRSCDTTSCGSCHGPGSGQCLSCAGQTVLKAGSCIPAACESVTSLGACLKDFASKGITKSSLDGQEDARGKKMPVWVSVLISLGIFALIFLLALLWRMRAMKKRAEKTQSFQQKKGLLGFLRYGLGLRRSKKDGDGDKGQPASDKPVPTVVHNHIELQPAFLSGGKSPSLPPYDFPQHPNPPYFKQQYMFPPSPSSESSYSSYRPARPIAARQYSVASSSRTGLEADGYGHPGAWQNRLQSSPRSSVPSSIDWPPPMKSVRSNGAHSPSGAVRPLFLRGSTSTASTSSYGRPANRRYGSADIAKDVETKERQRTLDLLTGEDGRHSREDRNFRLDSGYL